MMADSNFSKEEQDWLDGIWELLETNKSVPRREYPKAVCIEQAIYQLTFYSEIMVDIENNDVTFYPITQFDHDMLKGVLERLRGDGRHRSDKWW